jgi:hypothetical protein
MRVLLLLGIVTSIAAAQQNRVRAGEEPPLPTRGEIHVHSDPMLVRSLSELCARADAIVEGVVETDASRLMSRPSPVETDFWIAINRVLKGSIDTSKLVASQMGGTYGELHLLTNYPMLHTGQHYFLFLNTEKRPGVPAVSGLPRYRAETFYGAFIVDNGRLRSVFNDPFQGTYTGMTPDEFAAEIAAKLKR